MSNQLVNEQILQKGSLLLLCMHLLTTPFDSYPVYHYEVIALNLNLQYPQILYQIRILKPCNLHFDKLVGKSLLKIFLIKSLQNWFYLIPMAFLLGMSHSLGGTFCF